jgi:hypothetical protein
VRGEGREAREGLAQAGQDTPSCVFPSKVNRRELLYILSVPHRIVLDP